MNKKAKAGQNMVLVCLKKLQNFLYHLSSNSADIVCRIEKRTATLCFTRICRRCEHSADTVSRIGRRNGFAARTVTDPPTFSHFIELIRVDDELQLQTPATRLTISKFNFFSCKLCGSLKFNKYEQQKEVRAHQ